ncbi:NAD-dependent epimerase/dehydratase family protein [Rugosimonospora africana]|uniref:Nucleoside-diphosphate sugar epimerase n=1 Tax=Rugosimonospora africana TaxID=556532 RepID=A0A8J3QST4_9ACTN|nr:NAD-dependent epimerase/dehydratase family protein [Rugosimonospora africana]GIH15352.1 nucleoside-diphosphate sugar epimerase [Rugosimonospora africana]
MRVVVVGATGNVGTAVLRRLAGAPGVDEVTGVARRAPGPAAPYEGVSWHRIDVGDDGAVEELTNAFAGATVVIHLAWQIQPSHDRARIRRTNLVGTANVARAAVRASVPSLVVASSVGAYAPAPKDRFVEEDWPATGVRGSTYSRDKADVEDLLTDVESNHRDLRVVRIRSALVFQPEAASQIARFFIGPLAPLSLLRFGRIPVLPAGPRLRLQAVRADDAAEAYVRAALSDVRGAFNVAGAGPVLDAQAVADRFHTRPVPVPVAALRLGAALTWHARLQPTEPGWVRLLANAPLMSTRRAEAELGWRARGDALDAFTELVSGMAAGTGADSPPLRPRPSPAARVASVITCRLPGHGNPY